MVGHDWTRAEIYEYHLTLRKVFPIRWYHMLVYRLFYKFWDPLLRNRDDLRQFLIENLTGYDKQEKQKEINYHR